MEELGEEEASKLILSNETERAEGALVDVDELEVLMVKLEWLLIEEDV